ncbi:lymphocyte expansion molecule-like [Sitophilus oryzae]|uniref:Lymphocyte expansion molecule-like n=1 Tax=Sitophilus oryzae TaxID=7048 RepID=A0A6J2Y6V6_SITOR|nr:lymphocyte expansion molecule-like [Sitophilus oryzae]
MNEKPFKTNAPFGIATKRFTKIGFHPELDVSGAMKKEITKTGPGSYNPKQPICSGKSKKGMSWSNKLELEEFSKFLGFKNAHILRERIFQKSLRGPGSQEINENLFKTKSASAFENVGFGSGSRMHKEIMGQDSPPPDAYYRKLIESFSPSKKSFSTIPIFESDGLKNRFKSEARTYHLPPNLYTLRDGKHLVDITKKRTSIRGPYDCFTGPRDETTIKNYFARAPRKGADYFYINPSNTDHLLHHPSKKRCGMFLKANRFQSKPTERSLLNDLSLCYRNPNDPGPAHYDLSGTNCIKVKKKSLHPFDTSNMNARPPIDWRISPGPGRYTPKLPRCMKQKRQSWVFLSQQDRQLYKVISYSLYK